MSKQLPLLLQFGRNLSGGKQGKRENKKEMTRKRRGKELTLV